MAPVLLSCGCTVDVSHAMGDRRVWCRCDPPLEHAVRAEHVVATSYTARRLTPEPEPETEEVDA